MGVLYTFIEKIIFKNKLSNAFITNVLILKSKQKNPADWHYDTTLGVKIENKILLPLFINVFYVSIPKNMKKGHFEYQKYGSDKNKDYSILNSQFIKPETNMLCIVRGDVLHRVVEFKGNGTRISLVTEEYVVPSKYLKDIPEFKLIN